MKCLLSCDRAPRKSGDAYSHNPYAEKFIVFSLPLGKRRRHLGESSGEPHEGTRRNPVRGDTYGPNPFSSPPARTSRSSSSTQCGGTAFVRAARKGPSGTRCAPTLRWTA